MKLSLQDKTTVNSLDIHDELKTFYSKLSENKNVSILIYCDRFIKATKYIF